MFGRGAPLRRQVLILLALALLPGGAYAGLVAHGAYLADQERVREDLRHQAEAAASREREIILGAELVAKTLALAPNLLDDPSLCAEALGRVRDNFPEYRAALASDASGSVICAAPAPNRVPPPSVSSRAWFQSLMSLGRPTRAAEPTPLADGETAMIIAVPIPGPSGRPEGAIALVPKLENGLVPGEKEGNGGGTYLLLDSQGEVLPGSNDVALFPKGGVPDAPRGLDDPPLVFTGTGTDGVERIYALTTLPRGSVGVLFSRLEESTLDWVRRDMVNRLIGPFAMLLFTLAVTWVAMDRLVLHWLGRLRQTARLYARGDLGRRPALADAPQEIQELGATLSRMAETIQNREWELEENLHRREVLLKEIHHRVKNNLQVVSSLLSLQHRGLPEGAAKVALMQAQTRINALATVHRNLYDTEDPTLVNLGVFGMELVRLTHDGLGAPSRNIRLETDMARDVMVNSDQAVPLALILAESLTNAIKHAFPKGKGGVVRVVLAPLAEPPGGMAGPVFSHELIVEDNGVGLEGRGGTGLEGREEPDLGGSKGRGIGSTLMPSLARQAGGKAETLARPGGGTRVRIVFNEAISALPPFRAVTDP
ncbi:MAG: histidine kinase [Rhodospirillum sp.]|nr:histidine kinase [Rhodospirillum sp.]MCF8491856.1 histidine kinase [Rhodospirillum sp.]MCF8501143.1 histidine kinase [Rhodospirillum sp.]